MIKNNDIIDYINETYYVNHKKIDEIEFKQDYLFIYIRDRKSTRLNSSH